VSPSQDLTPVLIRVDHLVQRHTLSGIHDDDFGAAGGQQLPVDAVPQDAAQGLITLSQLQLNGVQVGLLSWKQISSTCYFLVFCLQL